MTDTTTNGEPVLGLERRPSFDRILAAATRAFTHFLYVAFIIAGVASAAVSSVAEYEVIAAFYRRHELLGITAFAVLMVFIMELVKVFLVFFNRAYSNVSNDAYAAVRPIFNSIRYALIGISVLCMMLFTLYNLSNPDYDKQFALAQAELRSVRDERLSQSNASYSARKSAQFALDDADVQFWRAKMQFEMNNVVGRTWEGKYFRSNKDRFEEARRKQEQNQERLERERLAEVSRIDGDVTRDVLSAKERLKTDPASQNQVLSAALQALNGGPAYAFSQYTAAAIIVSLLLSVTLESTIWVVFTALAVTYGDAFVSSLQFQPMAHQYAAAGRTLTDMDAADAKAFRERVVREKRSILEAVRGLLHRR